MSTSDIAKVLEVRALLTEGAALHFRVLLRLSVRSRPESVTSSWGADALLAFFLSEVNQLVRWACALPSCTYGSRPIRCGSSSNRVLQGIEPAELGMNCESSSTLHEVTHLV